jgi:deoxycytidylate deaminase
MIINTGISRVVCAQDYHGGMRSKEIFAEAGIKFNLLSPKMTTYADMGDGEITPEDKEKKAEEDNTINFINP